LNDARLIKLSDAPLPELLSRTSFRILRPTTARDDSCDARPIDLTRVDEIAISGGYTTWYGVTRENRAAVVTATPSGKVYATIIGKQRITAIIPLPGLDDRPTRYHLIGEYGPPIGDEDDTPQHVGTDVLAGLSENDPRAPAPEDSPHAGDSELAEAPQSACSSGSTKKIRISVLVRYTKKWLDRFAAAYHPRDKLQSTLSDFLHHYIATSNVAFKADTPSLAAGVSRHKEPLPFEFELAGHELLENFAVKRFLTSEACRTQLYRCTLSHVRDEKKDEALRDERKADVVAVFVAEPDGNLIGLADAIGAESDQAFVIVRATSGFLSEEEGPLAWDNLTLTHEIGHLVGARHEDRLDECGKKTFACGFKHAATHTDGTIETHATIMANDNKGQYRREMFSSPANKISEISMGTSGANDVARLWCLRGRRLSCFRVDDNGGDDCPQQ
jgi:hypothetical protein